MPWVAETLLQAIKDGDARDCITRAALVRATGLSDKQVESGCQNLRRHGFLTSSRRGCHTLTPAGLAALAEGARLRSGPKGPQASGQRRYAKGLRQRCWNALRLGKKLTLDDILMRTIEGDERDPRSNLTKYLRALRAAGYLRAMPLREAPLNPTSNGCLRWLLVQDTGPEAPVWRASRGRLYDPNLDAEVALGDAP